MDLATAVTVGRVFRTPYGGDGFDFIDQLNYRFSSSILLILIGIVGVRQYVGKPLQCWTPAEYTAAWEDYAENVCWVSNTYFLLPHEDVPSNDVSVRQAPHLSYYQWVAIVLAAQMLLSWVPHLIWRVGARRLPLLLQSAKEASQSDREMRHKAVLSLVAALEEIVESQVRYRRTRSLIGRCMFGVHPASRYTTLFFCVRAAFLANSVCQVFLMQRFIGHKSWYFGVLMLEQALEGHDWNLSGNFPRVTYCTFKVRKMGPQRYSTYTMQCVLPVNNFIEKMYIFLWFWFVTLACLTLLNTGHWMVRLLWPQRRLHYMVQYLRTLRHFSSTDERECARFVTRYVGSDGVFILLAVSRFSSDLMALDVAATLWTNYKATKQLGAEDDVARILESVHCRLSIV